MTVRDAGGQDASDMIARAPGLLLPTLTGRLSDEEMAAVLKFTDPRANPTPDDYYGFRLIAASDGLDSYYTRQDPETSLRNFGLDLAAGQSILGSHQTNTFSFGTSFAGEVVQADPSRSEYEATFYRQHAGVDEFRAKNWVVGQYAIPRGITLNGQSTDDLIRGIQLGANRRVSISFTVGQYRCGIDGEDMISGFFGLEGTGKCDHFPGVDYGEDGVATAIMRDGDLHETSLVFKNSSPSAMFLRKAEELAERGILSLTAVAQLEERLMVRLPRHVSPVYAGVGLPDRQVDNGTSQKERSMGDVARQSNPEAEAPPADDAPVEEKPVEIETEESAAETEEVEQPETTEEAAADQERAATGEKPDAEDAADNGADEGDAADAEDAADADDEDPEDASKKPERQAVKRQADINTEARLFDISRRWAEITEILGAEPTIESVRQLKADAALGTELFALEVDRAVKARIALQGEKFDAEKYRALLAGTRDIDFVRTEQDSYSGQRSAAFPVGRQVRPDPVEDRSPEGAVPVRDPRGLSPSTTDDGANLVSSLITKGGKRTTERRPLP